MAHKRPCTYTIVSYAPDVYWLLVEKELFQRRESLLESLGGPETVHIDVINPFGHITAREQQYREERLDDIGAGMIERVVIRGNRHTPYLEAILKAFGGTVENKAEPNSPLDFAIQEHYFRRNSRALS